LTEDEPKWAYQKEKWISHASSFILDTRKTSGVDEGWSKASKEQNRSAFTKPQVILFGQPDIPSRIPSYVLSNADVPELSDRLLRTILFDLVVTSAPYSIRRLAVTLGSLGSTNTILALDRVAG
jgi:hypothetical protein